MVFMKMTVLQLKHSSADTLQQMGRNGSQAAQSYYTYQSLTDKLEQLF